MQFISAKWHWHATEFSLLKADQLDNKLSRADRLDQFCIFETFRGFLLPSERLSICQKFFFKVQMESTRTLQAYLKVCPSGPHEDNRSSLKSKILDQTSPNF